MSSKRVSEMTDAEIRAMARPRPARRHPAEMTADRLLHAYERWSDRLTGAEGLARHRVPCPDADRRGRPGGRAVSASERPQQAPRPVPPNVRQAWSYVRDWSWQSPLRLRGEHPEGTGAYLIVIEDGPDRPRYIGQGIGPGTSAGRTSEIYADLHVHLARTIAHETACLDGAPVRADHDHDRCRFCGLLAAEHEVPGDDGATYQATHVTGPGTPAVTTAEAEAAIDVELAANKRRAHPAASRPGDEPGAGQ